MKKNTLTHIAYIALILAAIAGRSLMGVDPQSSASPSSSAKTSISASADTSNSAETSADAKFDITDYANTEITFSAADGTAISIPRYDGTSDVYTVSETPYFSAEDLGSTDVYFAVSNLDDLGRAGAANAVLGPESMQTHDRGSIADIHPSSWWEAKASSVNVNRSHLIGNNLAGDQTDCEENMIITII
jgi:hypothetical protein